MRYGLATVTLLGILVLILSISYSSRSDRSDRSEEQELICNYNPRVRMDDCMYFPISSIEKGSTTLNCYKASDNRGPYWRCPAYRR